MSTTTSSPATSSHLLPFLPTLEQYSEFFLDKAAWKNAIQKTLEYYFLHLSKFHEMEVMDISTGQSGTYPTFKVEVNAKPTAEATPFRYILTVKFFCNQFFSGDETHAAETKVYEYIATGIQDEGAVALRGMAPQLLLSSPLEPVLQYVAASSTGTTTSTAAEEESSTTTSSAIASSTSSSSTSTEVPVSSQKWWFIICTYIPGSSSRDIMKQYIPAVEEEDKEALKIIDCYYIQMTFAIAPVLRAFHSINSWRFDPKRCKRHTPEDFCEFMEFQFELIKENHIKGGILSPKMLEQLDQYLLPFKQEKPWLKEQLVLIHGDLHQDHVLGDFVDVPEEQRHRLVGKKRQPSEQLELSNSVNEESESDSDSEEELEIVKNFYLRGFIDFGDSRVASRFYELVAIFFGLLSGNKRYMYILLDSYQWNSLVPPELHFDKPKFSYYAMCYSLLHQFNVMDEYKEEVDECETLEELEQALWKF